MISAIISAIITAMIAAMISTLISAISRLFQVKSAELEGVLERKYERGLHRRLAAAAQVFGQSSHTSRRARAEEQK